jgi:hypothetical protein
MQGSDLQGEERQILANLMKILKLSTSSAFNQILSKYRKLFSVLGRKFHFPPQSRQSTVDYTATLIFLFENEIGKK